MKSMVNFLLRNDETREIMLCEIQKEEMQRKVDKTEETE
jgi:predicted DCC family thiol-disulfide oxidoreductase YuxK